MDITIEELNALTDKTSGLLVQITILQHELEAEKTKNARQQEEIVQLKSDLMVAQSLKTQADVENAFLKKFLILSAERIREFMKTLKTMREWTFARMFVEWAMPEKYRKEQKQLMDEIMGLPKSDLPQVLLENPTFGGPMYDVHDNEDVKL